MGLRSPNIERRADEMKSVLEGHEVPSDLVERAISVFYFFAARNDEDAHRWVNIAVTHRRDILTLRTYIGAMEDAIKREEEVDRVS